MQFGVNYSLVLRQNCDMLQTAPWYESQCGANLHKYILHEVSKSQVFVNATVSHAYLVDTSETLTKFTVEFQNDQHYSDVIMSAMVSQITAYRLFT